MRWLRFEQEGSIKLGKVENGRIQPVAAQSMQEVIRGEGTDPAGEPVPIQEVRPLAPLRPGKIVAVGQNYMDHIREQGNEPPGAPVLFPKFPTNVIGPEEEIRWPKNLTQQVDYEAELAVIIGEGGAALKRKTPWTRYSATPPPTTLPRGTCSSPRAGSGPVARP